MCGLMDPSYIRLPKDIELDPRAAQLRENLGSHLQLLWSGGRVRVPDLTWTPAVEATLGVAHAAGQLTRGLEGAERALAREDRGLQIADQKHGRPRGVRLSRLLILADDGAQRFYRNVETVLDRHGPRVGALRFEIRAERLGGTLFGTGETAHLVMIDHKTAVSALLRALVGDLRARTPIDP